MSTTFWCASRSSTADRDRATLHLLPTVWFRNTWSWGYGTPRPGIGAPGFSYDRASASSRLGEFKLWLEDAPPAAVHRKREQHRAAVGLATAASSYTKDAFHRYLIKGDKNAVNPDETGTKACGVYRIDLEPGGVKVLHFRLYSGDAPQPDFHQVFLDRIEEANEFYGFAPARLSDDARMVQRQAFAGLLWSKQFYHYVVEQWLKGDPAMPPPPPERLLGPQSDLDSRLQRRRALDARQVGVSVVRRLGSGVSHDPVRAGRSGFRQAPALVAAARVVSIAQWAASRL